MVSSHLNGKRTDWWDPMTSLISLFAFILSTVPRKEVTLWVSFNFFSMYVIIFKSTILKEEIWNLDTYRKPHTTWLHLCLNHVISRCYDLQIDGNSTTSTWNEVVHHKSKMIVKWKYTNFCCLHCIHIIN